MSSVRFTDPLKPQPTLKGYTAWVFSEVVETLGFSHAEGAAHIISQWIRDNAEELKEDFGISIPAYRNAKAAETDSPSKQDFRAMETELDELRAEIRQLKAESKSRLQPDNDDERKAFEEFKRQQRAARAESSTIQ